MTVTIDDHVLPRPVEVLPDYANAKARQNLADKLAETFELSAASAIAVANAVVDPSDVRRSIGEPDDPKVENIPVPGGTLLGVRTQVWSRRIMPDPRNPRTLPSRRHPFAVEPGTGGEDSKFRPVPEPRPLVPEEPQRGELAVDVESRHHLTWASQHAADYVIAENDWRMSIASQGVMEAVWLVATTYKHSDGSADATALTTAEGSSRTTAVHNILGVRSSEIPYDDDDASMRTRVRKLNQAYDRNELTKEVFEALRCERMPALILVGFMPYDGGTTSFSTAIKSLVALRHVDPPKPWGEGPENEALADEVLDELYRRDLISSTQRDFYAGACTRTEARAAHLPDDPVLRASEIVRLFTSSEDRHLEAIRVAVTSQSTRKRITSKLLNDLATALVLRAVAEDPAKTDQIRRYLRHAFSKSMHLDNWEATRRSTDQLVNAALKEVRDAIGSGKTGEPGPASLELAVRASYPLVVKTRLTADRGTINNDQPDRRTPGEVLDAMRRTPEGVLQLGQALRDYAADEPMRAVDENGETKTLANSSSPQLVSDGYLRREFPPSGKAKAAAPGETPTDKYNAAVEELSKAFDELERKFVALGKVRGDDDQPIVDSRGVELRLAEPWRDLLGRIDEEVVIWSRAYRKTYGAVPTPSDFVREEEEEEDPYADLDEDEVVK